MKSLYDIHTELAEAMRKTSEALGAALRGTLEQAMDASPVFAAYVKAIAEEAKETAEETERTKETGGEIMAPSTYKYNVYLYDDESPRFEDVPLKTFRNIEYSQMVDIAESATQFMDMLVVVEKALILEGNASEMTTEVEDHGGNEEE